MTVQIDPDVSESEAASMLTELVSIDTQNPPGRERPCAEFVHRTLTDWGIDAELIDEPFENRPQVLATVGAGAPGSNTLVLNGHMDVVSPGDPEEWTHDPFGGVVEDGRVYGRGASDMKGGLTAMLLAARAAASSGALDGQLVLTFAVGEETGEPGTKRLVDGLDADFGVVLEPTELVVDTAGKGLAWYTLTVEGSAGHASRPHLAENALDGLLSLDRPIRDYQARLADREHPLLGTSLCTPTICRAGETQNVIPDRAELRFDRRFLPDESVETIDEEMDGLAAPLREQGFAATVERTQVYEAAEIPTDATIAEVFRRHSAAVAGVSTDPHGKIASTDQRFLVNDADIPAIIWGPGTPSQAHTVDEWVRLDLLVQSVRVLCLAFEDLLVDG